ncbi:hypothetical protein [Pseudodesulfovibrio sp.]|uniref:hypothetical protein n=1 Tax=unclassified Pseudodesulfovibrio TaxID=2661612 RepID=UPI003AFF83B6
MSRNFFRRHRLLLGALSITLTVAVIFLLHRFNQWTTIRYQGVGQVLDDRGEPIPGVEIALLLTPPPSNTPARDVLFEQEGLAQGRLNQNGVFIGKVGPAIGLSDRNGAFIARATGRLGAAHAIRLGLDRSGRPAFATAWLVLRRTGYPDATRTISLLGWRPAPADWGNFANRIPPIILAP